MVIFRIGEYVHAFCTIFPCKVNYNVCLVIGLTCFGMFECVMSPWIFLNLWLILWPCFWGKTCSTRLLLSIAGTKLLMISFLWEKNLNTNFQNCSQMFVLICHCGGTCLISKLHSNYSKWSNFQETPCTLVLHSYIHLFTIMYGYGLL